MEHKNDQGMYRTGDIVIGTSDPGKSVYSITGTKINPDGVSLYGSEKDLMAIGRDFARSAIRSGGIPLHVNRPPNKPVTKKQSKKKAQNTQQQLDYSYMDDSAYHTESTPVDMPRSLTTVQFENDFGKIKSKVESIVEHELAFMLIFSDEDSVVFEPKIGELLALHTPDKRRLEVYYPGVTFDSPDNSKKLMILFKVPAEDQE